MADQVPEFTTAQKLDWRLFEVQNNVMHGRRYGHTDPRSTGLPPERHRFVIQHYAALRTATTGSDDQGRMTV